jgi:hypothetical protein
MATSRILGCLAFFSLILPAAHTAGQQPLVRPAYAFGSGPRVLYDTAHFNPSLGEGSRYRSVTELLRADGYQVAGGAAKLDASELARNQILVLVTPYAADPYTQAERAAVPVFSSAEVEALERWVRAGGSLLLVVGHEPSGAAHANLARSFGVDLRNGATMDATPANNWIEGDAGCLGCLKFTLENGLIGAHPVTRGRDSTERVTSVISAAGGSLGVSAGHHVLLDLGSTAYDVLASGERLAAGERAQGVAIVHGAGRVVILGDGSILTGGEYALGNPGFRRWWPVDPDNRQFTLNIMHWLSGLLPARP